MRRVYSPMTTDEVKERALRVLTPRLAPFGVSDITVREERDFDGTDVYRVVAMVNQQVPARVLIDGSDELQQLLRSDGEDRWMYLGTHRPSEADEDEGDEDEEDAE